MENQCKLCKDGGFTLTPCPHTCLRCKEPMNINLAHTCCGQTGVGNIRCDCKSKGFDKCVNEEKTLEDLFIEMGNAFSTFSESADSFIKKSKERLTSEHIDNCNGCALCEE